MTGLRAEQHRPDERDQGTHPPAQRAADLKATGLLGLQALALVHRRERATMADRAKPEIATLWVGGNVLLIALMTMFGIVSLPIYSLVIAHANDHLDPTALVKLNRLINI